MRKIRTIFAVILLMWVPFSGIAEQLSREQIKGLDEQVQDIKKDVLAISAELNLLEEKLLYPSNTQVSVFISVAKDSRYIPDAIQIKVDNKKVAYHIYSFKEVDALTRGGVQRIYTGNIRRGNHKLDVTLIGKVQGDTKNKTKSSFTINKGIGPKLVEVSLGSSSSPIEIKER